MWEQENNPRFSVLYMCLCYTKSIPANFRKGERCGCIIAQTRIHKTHPFQSLPERDVLMHKADNDVGLLHHNPARLRISDNAAHRRSDPPWLCVVHTDCRNRDHHIVHPNNNTSNPHSQETWLEFRTWEERREVKFVQNSTWMGMENNLPILKKMKKSGFEYQWSYASCIQRRVGDQYNR